MIQTLKSELKLRPTYDELVGMIESQGDASSSSRGIRDPNRPSITEVIDRKATIFRNNQFGSQFDNLDFLGLKKQEEDRARDNLRQAQVRKAGIDAGTSTGMMDLRARGFETPSEVNTDDEEDNIMLSEDIARIRAEMERSIQRRQQAQQATSSTARSDLDEAHRQSVPSGIPIGQPSGVDLSNLLVAVNQQPYRRNNQQIVQKRNLYQRTIRLEAHDLFREPFNTGKTTLMK